MLKSNPFYRSTPKPTKKSNRSSTKASRANPHKRTNFKAKWSLPPSPYLTWRTCWTQNRSKVSNSNKSKNNNFNSNNKSRRELTNNKVSAQVKNRKCWLKWTLKQIMSSRHMLRTSGVSLRILLTLILSLLPLMKSLDLHLPRQTKRHHQKLSIGERTKTKMLIRLMELLIKMTLLLKTKWWKETIKRKQKKLRKTWTRIKKKEAAHVSKNTKRLFLKEVQKLWIKWSNISKNKLKKHKSNNKIKNKISNKKKTKQKSKNQDHLHLKF